MNMGESRINVEYILAFFLLIWVGYGIFRDLSNDKSLAYYAVEMSALVLLLVLVALPNKTLQRTVGLYSIFYGVQSICGAYTMLEELIDDISFAICLLYVGVGILLIANGLTYLRGMSKNTNLMEFSLLFMTCVEVFFVIIAWREYYVYAVDEFLSVITPSIPYYISIALFLMIIKSDGIKQNTTIWKITNSVHKMRAGLLVDSTMTMTRDSLRKIVDIKYNGMHGPSTSILLRTSKNENLMALFENCDDGSIHVTVSSASDKSFIDGFIFRLTGLQMIGDIDNCGSVRLFGEGGIFVQFSVKDKIENDGAKRLPLFGKIIAVRKSSKS